MVTIHLTALFAALAATTVAIPTVPGLAGGSPIGPRIPEVHGNVPTPPLRRGITYKEPAEPPLHVSYIDIGNASFQLVDFSLPDNNNLSGRDVQLSGDGESGTGITSASAGKNAPILSVDTSASEAIVKKLKIADESLKAIASLVHVAIKATTNLGKNDREYRNEWVKSMLKTFQQEYPWANMMIYHRFGEDFEYTIDDESTKADMTLTVKRKDVLKTEFYNLILFTGSGTLLNKGDGGYLNWGFFGNYEWNGGKLVKFH